MEKRRLPHWRFARPRPYRLLRLAPLCIALSLLGCGAALNPAFVSIFDPTGTSASLDNAPGHVIIAFVNDVTVDERLLEYLEGPGGVTLTDEQRENLHPLIRATIRVTFTDQTVLELEAVTGNPDLVEAGFARPSIPDDTVPAEVFTRVGICDVASVSLVTTETEVFIPVEITGFELIQLTNDSGNVTGNDFEPRTRIPPQFRPLQIDDVDDNFNIVTLRNVDIRTVPSPVTNPLCGAVIVIALEGTLSVPFLERAGVVVSDAPSFDQDDEATIAAIGGRYQFDVAIK